MKKLILPAIFFVMIILGLLSVDFKYLEIDHTLKMAFMYARNYPPVFRSNTARVRLEKKLTETITELEKMLKSSPQDPGILFRLGKAFTFTYNLDLPGSRQKADQYFARLFQIDPGHAEGHLYYGQHLSGRAEYGPALEHLQKAAAAGEDIALNMIGMTYMQMGKPLEAKAYFLRMQKEYPHSRQLKMVLEAIDGTGDYTFETKREVSR